MPAQVVLNGNGVNGASGVNGAQHEDDDVAPGVNLEGFRWTSVDEKFNRLSGHHEAARVLAEVPEARKLVTPIPQLPPLGPIASFKGVFHGKGLNTIFRPANALTPSTTHFPNRVNGPPFPQVPNDQVLEINLTEETLSFSAPLGNVPNRGFGTQKDIMLNGVAYIQAINDVTNTATGRADGPPSSIHVEPGTWMHVPSSDDPKTDPTLVRMASIPHGTTINAQCFSPMGPPNDGAPDFNTDSNKVSIQPFRIGEAQGPGNNIPRFPSQTANDPNTARLPQDLGRFIHEGTITQEILDNPNKVLGDAIAGQKINSFVVFRVSTIADGKPKPVAGGGTANIDFLTGDNQADGPNADAVSMNATFWIEEVEEEVSIPPFPPGRPRPVEVHAKARSTGALAPKFLVHPPATHITGHHSITVKWTQIQYSQVVLLNFGGLSWPHVSVATLVPASPIPLTIPGV